MGDLSKELLKAGLISEKQARQTTHKERVQNKKMGHQGRQEEESRQKAAHEQRLAKQRETDHNRNKVEQQVVEEKMTRTRLKDLVKNGVATGTGGNRRFYLIASHGKVPYLEVNEDAIHALQRGRLGIVRIPDQKLERFVLLAREKAEQVKSVQPDLVVLLN